jgi:adenine-specific DNA-methyltransferase
VRYIGNKTKLLAFIGDVLDRRGIRGGTAVDPFTGTASVARALKTRGFRVVAADVMEYAYVFARAYVVVAEMPRLSALADQLGLAAPTVHAAARFLEALPPEQGFIAEHYAPDGRAAAEHGRMYFTPANAGRLDAMRRALDDWRRAGLVSGDAYFLLLAALLEGADRVANTTGVYAAFVKSWQPNALKPLELRIPDLVPGNGCKAFRGDALDVTAPLAPFDLLYLDPPYNNRQYAGYYHIPELIATGWFEDAVTTRGKTGLLDDADKRSDWSRARLCEHAFERLVAGTRWRHLVMSYNAEGIIPEATIERVLREHGRARTYRRYRRRYRRYRSDADGVGRRYRADTVNEYLYCVDR